MFVDALASCHVYNNLIYHIIYHKFYYHKHYDILWLYTMITTILCLDLHCAWTLCNEYFYFFKNILEVMCLIWIIVHRSSEYKMNEFISDLILHYYILRDIIMLIRIVKIDNHEITLIADHGYAANLGSMMTLLHANAFRITSFFWVKFTGQR